VAVRTDRTKQNGDPSVQSTDRRRVVRKAMRNIQRAQAFPWIDSSARHRRVQPIIIGRKAPSLFEVALKKSWGFQAPKEDPFQRAMKSARSTWVRLGS